MKKEFRTIEAGGQSFRVTWDMTAFHMLEKAGKASRLDTIHAGVVAAAASEGRPEPIGVLQLGSLFSSVAELEKALEEVVAVATANGFISQESEPGKAEAPEKASTSGDAISMRPSISA